MAGSKKRWTRARTWPGDLRDRHQGLVSMFHFFENINFGHFPYSALSPMVWLLILVALTFDFLNGLHDAANSVATVVSTRVLSPRAAVIWAAFFNFAALLLGTKVAATIAKDVV